MKKLNLFTRISMVILAIITLFPFIYMILSSLMTFQEATSIPPTLIPEKLNFSNYKEAMEAHLLQDIY